MNRDPPKSTTPYGSTQAGRPPTVETARRTDTRRPLYLVGFVMLAVIPAAFAAVWLVAGRDGSEDEQAFGNLITFLMLVSTASGALTVGLAGFLRLVTGARGRRPAFPALPRTRRALPFLSRRTARVDLRAFWIPTLPLLLFWSVVGSLQPTLPFPGTMGLFFGTGLCFFVFLYFWSLGLLRAYSVERRPAGAFFAVAALAVAAFLLPFLVADPTRYPGLLRPPGIVLLQSPGKRILPLL